jgi:DNA polymerase-3 subunit gamma/tau
MRASGGAAAPRPRAHAPEPEPAPRLDRYEDVIALAKSQRDLALAYALERDVRLVSFEQGRIEFEPSPGARDDLAKTIARRLLEWTGERWLVALSTASGGVTVGERRDRERQAAIEEARRAPLVRAILEGFPGAEIVDVREPGAPDPVEAELASDPLADPDLDEEALEPLELPPDDDS